MKQEWLALAIQLMQLGFMVALPLVGGLVIGLWADRALGTLPLFTLLGSMVGITAGTVAVFKVVSEAIARAAKIGRRDPGQQDESRQTDEDDREDEE